MREGGGGAKSNKQQRVKEGGGKKEGSINASPIIKVLEKGRRKKRAAGNEKKRRNGDATGKQTGGKIFAVRQRQDPCSKNGKEGKIKKKERRTEGLHSVLHGRPLWMK